MINVIYLLCCKTNNKQTYDDFIAEHLIVYENKIGGVPSNIYVPLGTSPVKYKTHSVRFIPPQHLGLEVPEGKIENL